MEVKSIHTQINLASALAKAQSEFKVASRSGYNPHFKSSFSTLDDLIEASRMALTKYGLSVTQYPHSDGDMLFLVTKLMHAGGENELSCARLFLKDPTDIQKLGSAMSYMKRYAYAGICGVATGEEDDDGNSTQSYQPSQNVSSEVKSEFISTKQYGLLKSKIAHMPAIEAALCKQYNIPSLDKLPWRHMKEVMNLLESTTSQPDMNDQLF